MESGSDNLPFLESLAVLSCINSSYKTISAINKGLSYAVNVLYWYFFITSVNIFLKGFAHGYFSLHFFFFISVSLSVISRELTIYFSLC